MTAGLGRRRENDTELRGASTGAWVMYCTIADASRVAAGKCKPEFLHVPAATVRPRLFELITDRNLELPQQIDDALRRVLGKP